MGSNEYGKEQPIHTVYLDEFEIAKYPVTNSQYACFVAATGSPACRDTGVAPHRQTDCAPTRLSTSAGKMQLPSAHGWASRTMQRYAWPTEAEWEKAARGTDGREYPWK
jgi:formylglycine-generating enzyme required for sulfatase activity